MPPLLSVTLSVDYPARPKVLDNVALTLAPGEVVGLVGQSGSGKSTLGLGILRLLGNRGASVRGQVNFDGRDLLHCPEREMRRVRGRQIGLVLQNPLASLNPALRLRTQMEEAWRAHAKGSRREIEQHLLPLLAEMSLPATPEFLSLYPRQLSVGMAQRVLIAMSVLHRPPLLIADEPTSALDVITQSEVLQLFRRLNEQRGTAILYISHDLLSVAALCHRVAILHQGQIVEQGETSQLFRSPQHPYTRRLIAALPQHPCGAPDVQATESLSHLLDAVKPAPALPHSEASPAPAGRATSSH